VQVAGTYLLTVAGKYTTGGTTLIHTTTLTLVVQTRVSR
jgi:hypothetical protein